MESLSRLKELRGSGTQMISLYVPDGKIADAASLLRDEIGKAACIRSRVTKQAVIAGIKSCQERLKMLSSGHHAIFVGNTSSGWISESVETPKPLKGIIYVAQEYLFILG